MTLGDVFLNQLMRGNMINTFQYNGKIYTKITPAKTLFRSNLIHEATTRGSIFALDVQTGTFTILPGHAMHEGNHREYELKESGRSVLRRQLAEDKVAQERRKLTQIRDDINSLLLETTR